MLRILAVLAILLTLLSVREVRALEPGAETWDADVMRGITAFHLVVRPLSGDAGRAGLEATDLKVQVEDRLRREGIALGRGREAVLRLTLDDIAQDPGPASHHDYWLTLELVQEAQLVDRPGTRSPVVTWSRIASGSHPAADVPAQVHQSLRGALDDLVRDYRSVNSIAELPAAAHLPEGD